MINAVVIFGSKKFKEDEQLFGLISRKKFINAVRALLEDSANQNKATDKWDMYWRFGNAHAVNYICHKVGVDSGKMEVEIINNRNKEDE